MIRYGILAAASAAALTQALGAHAQDTVDQGEADVITVFSRVPQPLEQVGSATSTFTAADIELQELFAVDEVLERIPGVAITRSGGFGQNTQVRMRGFTTKHTLFLVDGVKVNNPSEFDNQFGVEHLILDNIERIEVLRGPQSGLYGADAVAGVVGITTRRGQGDPTLRVSALSGSNETFEAAAASDGEVAGVGYSASVRYFETGGISLASRPPGNVEDDGYQNLSVSGNLDYTVFDGFDLRAGLRYSDSENETDNNFLFGDPVLPNFLFQDSEGEAENQQLIAYGGGSLETLGGALVHDLQVSVVDLQGESRTPSSAFENTGRTWEAQYFATYFFGENNFVLAGADATREEAEFNQTEGFAFATVDDEIDNVGVFATVNLEPLKDLFVSLSGRFDDNSEFDTVTTGRVAVAYTVPQTLTGAVDTRLRSSAGTGREAPGLRQLLGSSPTFVGNPDVEPEETWMVDAGVDLGFDLFGGPFDIALTYYYGEAENGIFTPFNPDLGVSSPANAEDVVEMEGVELEMRYAPAAWLDLSFAYTNARSELLDVSVLESGDPTGGRQQLFGRPENEFSFAATARPTDRLSVTFDGYARSEFFSDFPSTFVLDGYQLYNLSGQYDLTGDVRLAVSVKNLFDEDYEEKLGDGTFGRTVTGRITVTF